VSDSEIFDLERAPALDIPPPNLTGAKRKLALRTIKKIVEVSTDELQIDLDRQLFLIKEARARSKGLKGEISGKIKFQVYIARERLKNLWNALKRRGTTASIEASTKNSKPRTSGFGKRCRV
jgi:hypothetical protein